MYLCSQSVYIQAVNRRIITTADGSNSIYVRDLNEYYHSIYGAVQESEHVFIQSGLFSENLKYLNNISVLEIGFGTGLNALLTYFSAIKTQKQIHYTTIEPYPLSTKEIQLLNYKNILPYDEIDAVFSLIHAAEWEKSVLIAEHFTLCKHKISALDMQFQKKMFNLVYFDAFSPDVQPELWSNVIFEKIYNSLISDGVFVTYSAKGSVKRALKHVGFCIEKLPGPPGKREILRGKKG